MPILFTAAIMASSAGVLFSRINDEKYNKEAPICKTDIGCEASGVIEMSSDGHAFIAIMHLTDGRCLNVSFNNSKSRKILKEGPKWAAVKGDLYHYPEGDDVFEFRINKRKIGFGRCGDDVLFVK